MTNIPRSSSASSGALNALGTIASIALGLAMLGFLLGVAFVKELREPVARFANAPVPLTHVIGLAALMFMVGLYGVLTRRNLIAILMGVEILLNACMVSFVGISSYTDQTRAQGQVFALFIIAIAAAEVAVGLAIFINVFRAKGGVTTDDLTEMHS